MGSNRSTSPNESAHQKGKSTVKNKFTPRGQKDRLHQMRAPTKREITVKNNYASRSPPTTSFNESTHQKGHKNQSKRRARTLKDKRPHLSTSKQKPHYIVIKSTLAIYKNKQ